MVQQASQKPVFPPSIAPYIDVAAYLLDARAPASSLWLDPMLAGRELLLLTRADQADPQATRAWRKRFSEAGYPCIALSSTKRLGVEEIKDYLARLLRQKLKLAEQRGITNATLRMAALGVPNVGKSTFLNTLLGAKRFKTGDKPGVTRGPQWVRLFEDVEVLDTAGILRDAEAVKKRKPTWMLLNLMPWEPEQWEASVELLRNRLPPKGWQTLGKLYKADAAALEAARDDNLELLGIAAAARGYKLATAQDAERAAQRIVRDFQLGKLGRLTLDPPDTPITSPHFRG